MKSFSDIYRALLTDIWEHGVLERNARTGVDVKALPGGTSFRLDLADGLPVAGNRRYWPHVASAEVAWQFMGTTDPTFIVGQAPKLWSKFVEDGQLKAAYGYRWREHFGRDQLEQAIETLMADPSSRQVYIAAWDPSNDGLGAPYQPKNIPCPVGFALNVVGGSLHCSVFLRSSDVFVGLPYDVMAYALTTDAIAADLGIRPGVLHVTLAHAHLYRPHFPAVVDCLVGGKSYWHGPKRVSMPGWESTDILVNPEGYVEHVRRIADGHEWNTWNPMPEVVE